MALKLITASNREKEGFGSAKKSSDCHDTQPKRSLPLNEQQEPRQDRFTGLKLSRPLVQFPLFKATPSFEANESLFGSRSRQEESLFAEGL